MEACTHATEHPAGDKRTVLVLGATGNQGGAVVRSLLNDGNYTIKAVTRNPQSADAKQLQSQGVQLLQCDMNKVSLDELAKQFAGVYGVFSVQTKESHDNEIAQGKKVAGAAAQAGVQHLVYSSVANIEQTQSVPHCQTKQQIEDYIRTLSDKLSYTILRPAFFMGM